MIIGFLKYIANDHKIFLTLANDYRIFQKSIANDHRIFFNIANDHRNFREYYKRV